MRINPRRLILLGFGLVFCGLLLALTDNAANSVPVFAQSPQETSYTGASSCGRCHKDLGERHKASRHALALQNVSRAKEAIKADFTTGEKERTVQFPGESTARPFTPNDVYYVIGSGRYVERYVYRIERGKYAVFPAEWNVATKSWQPYTRGATWPDDAAYNFTTNCAGCHVTGINVARGRWEDEGVQCEACHGPGSVHAEAAFNADKEPTAQQLAKIRASIVLSPDAQICGQCHSRGAAPEGENGLPFSTKYRPGTNLLAADVFALVDSKDPDHWWASGHAKQANMQFNEWLNSAHSQALETLKKAGDAAKPECLSCHSADYDFTNRLIAAQQAGTRKGDPVQPLTVETAKNGVTCTSCHNPHSKGEFGFNLIADSYTLCTTCHKDTEATPDLHYATQEMFEGKPVVSAVQGIPSVHFTTKNGPKCQDCHGPRVPVDTYSNASHTLQIVRPGATGDAAGLVDSCTTCHTSTSPDEMARFIANSQTGTENRLKAAEAALKANSPEWVRTALAFVRGDGSLGVHNHRYTAALLSAVEVELGLIQPVVPPSVPVNRAVENPAKCAECHQNEHNQWLTSPHANASLSNDFRKEFARLRQPTYCMSCHASGYDQRTGSFVFEGVVCSTCHYTENGADHPPAPVKIASDSLSCGRCHSGVHAPTYDEWLVSSHNTAGIDCVDCHTPHNNGLKQGDINTTCGNCHPEALTDPIHMGENLDCKSCHMKRQLDAAGVHVIRTGHSMLIDPGVCAECHGNVHLLSARTTGIAHNGEARIKELENEIARLTGTAQTNWAMGIAGGAIGMMVVVLAAVIIARRGKLL